MSYILDALRKSDQQRRRGAAPTLLAGPVPLAAPKQTPLLTYGLLAAVLLGAGMAIGWLRPWQGEHATPAAQKNMSAPAPSAAPAQAPLHAPALAQVKSQAPASARAEAPVKPRAAVATDTRKLPAAPGQPPAAAAADSVPAQTVISLAELPLALQQELPPMMVSVHAYSGNPRDRLVGINNRMLREGDEVVTGLKLEQITSDGMIFGYKGYSFRRGVR